MLSQEPKADRHSFFRWHIGYRAAQIYDEIRKPITITETVEIIKKTDFQNADLLFHFVGHLSTLRKLDPLPLGAYTANNIKYYCTIELQHTMFPDDFNSESASPEPCLVHLKSPVVKRDPFPFFSPLGRLYCSTTASTSQEEDHGTSFAVVVDPYRTTWAIFTPYSIEDHGELPDPDDDWERSSCGVLPGFKTACTAVKLGQINDLLPDATSSAPKTMTINPKDFAVLENTRFADVDAESLEILRDLVPNWGPARETRRTAMRTIR